MNRFAVTGLSVLAGIVVWWTLSRFAGLTMPLLIFILPLTFSGWYGGLWPGLLATLLGAAIACWTFLWVPASGAFREVILEDVLRLAIFGLSGVFISVLNEHHKRTERTVRESEEQFRALFENSKDALGIAVGGLHVLVNQAYARTFRYGSPDQLVGKPVLDLIADNEKSAIQSRQARRMQGLAEPTHYVTRGLRKDGSEFDMEIRLSMVHVRGQASTFCIVRNITAEKEAQETLRLSEEKFRRLFDSSLIGMAFWTLEGTVLEANDRYLQLVGYTREELVAGTVMDWRNFTPPEYAEQDIQAGAEMIETGASRLYEKEYIHRDGKRVPVVLGLSLADAVKKTGVSFVVDITERKAAERSLSRKAAELARSNEDLQQFAYVASHDLQEPLRMISGYGTLLSRRYRGKIDADADEFLGYMVDGANRMTMLVRDLLEYSRVVNERDPTLQPVEMSWAVKQALANLRVAITETQTEITCGPLPTVFGTPLLFIQLFQNLIGNAIKYRSGAPLRVSVSADRQGREWLFRVADNGMGIAPQHHEQIFKVFSRVDRTGDAAGTGIGLAICHKIVEQHGGRIWVESELEKGSTFLFTVPFYAPGAVQQSPVLS